jgi:hypothetical protein
MTERQFACSVEQAERLDSSASPYRDLRLADRLTAVLTLKGIRHSDAAEGG